MSELLKRVLVAIVGIPIGLTVIYLGSWYLITAIIIISLLAVFEYYKLAENKQVYPNMILGLILSGLNSICLNLFFNSGIYAIQKYITPFFISFILLTLMILTVELWRNKENKLLNTSITITGSIFIPFLFSFIIAVYYFFENIEVLKNFNFEIIDSKYIGTAFVIFILVSIWISDSAAYFIGKKFGKHKLFEKISPKKTWEGAIAGFFGAIFAFHIFTHWSYHSFPIIHTFIIGAIIGTVGVIGDLAESMLKRDTGVKDSSNLIPGHGGILDRFDSILFVFPIVYIYLFLVFHL